MASFNAKRMESISGSNSYPGPGSTPSSFGTSKRLGCTIKCLLILVSFSQMQSIGNAQTPGQTEMGSDTSPEASGSAGTTLKMSSALSSFDIVVALDIGTAETGSAFFVKEQPNVYLAGLKGMKDAVKIPTTVLVHMSASGEPQGVAFGDDAIEEYENMKNDDGGKYALFERFKMRMFNEKGILVSRPTIPAADGVQRLNIVQILAIWMRYLKQQLQFVLQSQGKELHLDRTLWVMTVPSIWSQGAKQIMTEAAHKAGLVKEASAASENIMICLEPTAGLLWSMYGSGAPGKSAQNEARVGKRILLLDCGGGTVNFIMVEITSKMGWRHLIAPSSGQWGSTRIEEAFWQLLCDVFGDVVEKWKKQRPAQYHELMSEFIRKKKSFDGEAEAAPRLSKTIRLNVHGSLQAMLVEHAENKVNRKCDATTGTCVLKAGRTIVEVVRDAVSGYKGRIPLDGFRWDDQDNRFVMASKTMAALFETVVTPLIAKVTELVRQNDAAGNSGKINEILMVGGFSQSPYLIGRIRQSFPALAPRLDPRSAVAVLNGALNYAKWAENENTILDLSFGVQSIHRFSSLTPARQVLMQDLKRVYNSPDPYDPDPKRVSLFDPFFVKGQSYEFGSSVPRAYIPQDPMQEKMKVQLIACSDPNAFHPLDAGCEPYGTMIVPTPLPPGVVDRVLLKQREVEVTVTYKHNMFHAVAVDKTSGQTKQLNVDFFNAP